MNHVQLIGSIVNQELRYTPNGNPILDTTLAGMGERAAWYQRVSMFAKTAELMADLPIGTILHVQGKLHQERWESKDGQKRTAVKVMGNLVNVINESWETEVDKRGQPVLRNALHVVTLLGGITRDVEVRQAGSGRIAASAVAVSKRRKVGDEWEEESHYFDFGAWSDSPAFGVLSDARKGQKVFLSGQLVNRSWEGEDGQRRYKSEVVVSQAGRVIHPRDAVKVAVESGAAAPSLDIDEFPEAGDLPF